MKIPDSVVTGPQALLSSAGLTIVAFWLFLGLVAYIPNPAQKLLRGSAGSGRDPSVSAMPTVTPSTGVSTASDDEAKQKKTIFADAVKASKRAPQNVVEPIDGPDAALAHFSAILRRLKRRDKGAFARVLHFGDSQIDLDHVTKDLRRIYQKRYGHGGIGFVPAVRPWRWFDRRGVTLQSSTNWTQLRLVQGERRDGRLGLGGLAAESDASPQKTLVALVPGETASRVELHYLKQPAGGAFSVRIDGTTREYLSTAASKAEAAYKLFELSHDRHVVSIHTRGAVRLFGVVFERPGPGITWESLPMVGTRFDHLDRLKSEHWRDQLKHRNPDFVVFQFGANDTISYGGDIERYGERVSSVLRRLRQAVPQASCLVIGPPDRMIRRGGELISSPVVPRVAAKQRQAAHKNGCAFWNAQRAMGGPGSMSDWVESDLIRKDMVHFNNQGSARFAKLLDEALTARLRRVGKDG